MAENSQAPISTDLVEGFRSIILDRFSSPLILSFAISWSLFNYEVFMIVANKATINHKLKLIDWYFYTDHSYNWHTILFPLFSALVYVFIYPFLNRKVQKFVLERKLEELSDKNDLEKKALFTYEHVEQIYLRHAKEIERYKNDIQRLNDTERQLQAQLNEISSSPNLQTNPSPESTVNPQKVPDLNEVELHVIKLLGDNENRGLVRVPLADITKLLDKLEIQPVESKMALDHLREMAFIDYAARSGTFAGGYSMSQKGRAIYVDMAKSIRDAKSKLDSK